MDWFEDKAQCERCGRAWVVATNKRKRTDLLCASCRAKPTKSISYGFGSACQPWAGEFDAQDNPMLDGHLFMPGNRICGHRDCVTPTHCHP